MSKTISANLKTEIESGAPNVCTCWKIERTDGTILGFTDWPESFTYNTVVYSSSGGYQRTALDQKSGLNVDNMDLVGLIDSSFITEEDLLIGKYRDAKIWIFMVSPNNLAWGEVALDYGLIGEIEIKETAFVAEFRSLSVRLAQEFGSKYSRYCRHQLGESKISNGSELKCGIVLEPDLWVASTVYSIGDVVSPIIPNGRRFICTTGGTSSNYSTYDYSNYITTPKAYWRMDDTSPSTTCLDNTANNYDGTYVGSPTLQATSLLTDNTNDSVTFNGSSQYVNLLTPRAGVEHTSAFTYELWFKTTNSTNANMALFSFEPQGSGNDGRGIKLRLNPFTETFQVQYGVTDDGTFHYLSPSPVTNIADGNPHFVSITFGGAGNDIVLYVDNVEIARNSETGNVEFSDRGSGTTVYYALAREEIGQYFDGTIDEFISYARALTDYERTVHYLKGTGTHEPVWDIDIGDTTTETGGVAWKTYDAYMKYGTVRAVTSRRTFTDSDFTQANDWWQYGVLTWLSGNNTGLSIDIKDSTNAGVFTLRKNAVKDIQIGDTFKVHWGCNHILKMPNDTKGSPYTGDCRAKFKPESTNGNTNQFGGEPELPNLDRVSTPATSA